MVHGEGRVNAYHRELMDKLSLRPGYCVVCGKPYPTGHHVVPRSQGGLKGPVLDLCGSGTTGHHGMAEDKKLHFRWRDRWEWRETATPTKYEKALAMDGWRECGQPL